ncbi:hypothetical protein Tco_1041291 [Tanacetum coccineum]|uniref:Uncharacterized protein n=1 Tax=Tanacetum coccineum TaxID=301880 RepID=A0ABQ5GFR7_9ASTR
MTPEAIEELINRRVEEALAAYEATHAANSLEAKSQSPNGSDDDNGNGGNENGGNGNPNKNNRDAKPVARECTYQDFMKCQPLNFKGTKELSGSIRLCETRTTSVISGGDIHQSGKKKKGQWHRKGNKSNPRSRGGKLVEIQNNERRDYLERRSGGLNENEGFWALFILDMELLEAISRSFERSSCYPGGDRHANTPDHGDRSDKKQQASGIGTWTFREGKKGASNNTIMQKSKKKMEKILHLKESAAQVSSRRHVNKRNNEGKSSRDKANLDPRGKGPVRS